MAFTGNFICNSFSPGLMAGSFNFALGTTDVYRVALYTNSATLDATTVAYTTAGEVVASGYTAGGNTILPIYASSDGGAYVSFTNVSWNAAFTARGALVYKAGDNGAICVLDFGADRTSTTVFSLQFPLATADQALLRLP
jgi:hypothetical protein